MHLIPPKVVLVKENAFILIGRISQLIHYHIPENLSEMFFLKEHINDHDRISKPVEHVSGI